MTATAPPAAASAADANDPLMAVVCPSCQAALAVPQALGGDRARCPLCLAGFTVPSPPRPKAGRSDRDGDAPTAEESRLSGREERSVRRGRRNIVMLVFGTVILLVIVLVFGSQKPKKRR